MAAIANGSADEYRQPFLLPLFQCALLSYMNSIYALVQKEGLILWIFSFDFGDIFIVSYLICLSQTSEILGELCRHLAKLVCL